MMSPLGDALAFSPIDWIISFRLLVAILLGGIIGLEREFTGHPAGLRTHILVSLGSAAFLLTAMFAGNGNPSLNFEPSRVVQGIITGMGFIGAGSIMKEGFHIHGITTAASLWVVSSVGVMIASGMLSAAIVVTVLTLVVLILSRPPLRRTHNGHPLIPDRPASPAPADTAPR